MSLQEMEALRARFRARAIEDLDPIRTWLATGERASDAIERMIHNLAGAAGTFGYPDLHQAASRVDDALCAGSVPDASDGRALIAAIVALPR
ncbi:MAG: Hpt domain-containing protein [Brevundimonas sp.]|nr:MAG: Hpt domain-containing protein [Brevundimonas sp.]